MYALGYAAGRECARMLCERVRTGTPPAITVLSLDREAGVQVEPAGQARAFGESVTHVASLDIGEDLVVVTLLVQNGDPVESRHFLEYEITDGKIATSTVPIEGFDDGLAEGDEIVAGALPPSPLYGIPLAAPTTPAYADAGYASAIAVVDMFVRRSTMRLATEVRGAFIDGDEVRLETFETMADAIAAQREQPVAGFAILQTYADKKELTIRVPDPSAPERPRITCEVRYAIVADGVHTSDPHVHGDSPFEMSDFMSGFDEVLETEPPLSGWGKLGSYHDHGEQIA